MEAGILTSPPFCGAKKGVLELECKRQGKRIGKRKVSKKKAEGKQCRLPSAFWFEESLNFHNPFLIRFLGIMPKPIPKPFAPPFPVLLPNATFVLYSFLLNAVKDAQLSLPEKQKNDVDQE